MLHKLTANDFDDDDEEMAMVLLATVVAGAEEGRQIRNALRHRRRISLHRKELMPYPRIESAWMRLWNSQEDRAFITTMGIDVATFRLILEGPGRFGESWENTPIPRPDVDSLSYTRMGRRSLDGAGGLALVLHYLGSAMLEVSLQQIFALTPSVLSRYLEFGQDILHRVVTSIPQGAIRMPEGRREFRQLQHLIAERHPLLTGAFGSIDGLSLPVQESDNPDIENATYNGWKSAHRINNIIIFSPEGVILSARLNAPGSWHDSRVAERIYEQLVHVPDGFYLVADSGFPKGSHLVEGKIKVPLKSGDHVPVEGAQQEQVLRFNRQLLSYRQTAEWGMRMLQGSFGRLRVPLPIASSTARQRLLETCCRLANIRARCVGINQIRSVYMPVWKDSEDERLWAELGDMLFSDIRRSDRVSRFHLVVVEDIQA